MSLSRSSLVFWVASAGRPTSVGRNDYHRGQSKNGVTTPSSGRGTNGRVYKTLELRVGTQENRPSLANLGKDTTLKCFLI